MSSIETLAAKLITLSTKTELSKGELEEVKKLMRLLKAGGMSVEEISKLAGGKWSPSTVKGYTTGVKASQPSEWQDTVSILNSMVTEGITLDDVQMASHITKNLETHHIDLDLDQVSTFLSDMKSTPVNVSEFIKCYQDLKQSGLTPKDVQETLSLKNSLEQQGVKLETLKPILTLAKTYGSPAKITEAVTEYGSLQALKQETMAAESKIEQSHGHLADINHKIEEAGNALDKKKEMLNAIKAVTALGFSPVELGKISNLSERYGGLNKVLTAVEGYIGYLEIVARTKKAEKKLSAVLGEIAVQEGKSAHLKTGITMCQTLVTEYGYSLDAIAAILSAAKKFGEPAAVLNVLEKYAIVAGLEQEREQLATAVAALNKEISRLKGEQRVNLEALASLQAKALEAGQQIGFTAGQIAASNEMHKILNLVSHPNEADYPSHVMIVMIMATSLRKWVLANEDKFKLAREIEIGLKYLVIEAGGLNERLS